MTIVHGLQFSFVICNQGKNLCCSNLSYNIENLSCDAFSGVPVIFRLYGVIEDGLWRGLHKVQDALAWYTLVQPSVSMVTLSAQLIILSSTCVLTREYVAFPSQLTQRVPGGWCVFGPEKPESPVSAFSD